MSVVFDFNASLNDIAPALPIMFAVDLIRMKKKWFVDGCHLCFISFVLTTKTELTQCCV